MAKEMKCQLCGDLFIRKSGVHKYCSECSPTKAANIRAGRFGIGQKEFDRKLQEQGGVCLLCEKVAKRFVVDHKPNTDILRGILCVPCNSNLGMLESGLAVPMRSSVWRKRAKQYLRSAQWSKK